MFSEKSEKSSFRKFEKSENWWFLTIALILSHQYYSDVKMKKSKVVELGLRFSKWYGTSKSEKNKGVTAKQNSSW